MKRLMIRSLCSARSAAFALLIGGLIFSGVTGCSEPTAERPVDYGAPPTDDGVSAEGGEDQESGSMEAEK